MDLTVSIQLLVLGQLAASLWMMFCLCYSKYFSWKGIERQRMFQTKLRVLWNEILYRQLLVNEINKLSAVGFIHYSLWLWCLMKMYTIVLHSTYSYNCNGAASFNYTSLFVSAAAILVVGIFAMFEYGLSLALHVWVSFYFLYVFYSNYGSS